MLDKSHYQAYQQLHYLLEKLNKSLSKEELESKNWDTQGTQIQQISEQLISLTSDSLDSSLVPRWRSLTTELYRELRLLKTDLLFLSAAKNTATQEARINTLRERLARISSFCQLLSNLGE